MPVTRAHWSPPTTFSEEVGTASGGGCSHTFSLLDATEEWLDEVDHPTLSYNLIEALLFPTKKKGVTALLFYEIPTLPTGKAQVPKILVQGRPFQPPSRIMKSFPTSYCRYVHPHFHFLVHPQHHMTMYLEAMG
jgi:hypothetical protein